MNYKENILLDRIKDTFDFWLAKFPKDYKRSAVLACLHVLQDVNGGFLLDESIIIVADYLLVPRVFVYEVATFYTMYNLKNLIKNKVCVCTNITCSLYGSVELVEDIKVRYAIGSDGVSRNRNFFFSEVECLAVCDKALFIQVNKLYYFKFTKEMIFKVLDELE